MNRLAVLLQSALLTALVALMSGNEDQAPRYPLSPTDKRIDALGSEQNIKSEQEAGLLIQALLAKFQIDESRLPGISVLMLRMEKAEYAAVLHRELRVPESSVANAFNLLMDRMSMPEFTRVSAEEVHAFRVARCLTLYPRDPDGNFPTTVRPVEAAYLVYLLYANRGVSQNIRRAIAERGLPRPDPSTARPPSGFETRGIQLSQDEFRRRRDYWNARSRYLATHTDSDAMDLLMRVCERIGVT